jgi:hypothetical protein
MPTTKVTANGSDRIAQRTGEQMEKWLFFDRVDVMGDTSAIDQGVQTTIPVFTNPAHPPPAVIDVAMKSAKMAVDRTFLTFFPETCCVHPEPVRKII